MIEVIIAATMCCVLFYAPAMLTRYWGQPRLLASLLSLGGLVGLTVVSWLVTAYWMRSSTICRRFVSYS
jgi:ABC-type multidrug transport system permease subunit